jgi:hypothetical protein
VSEARPYVALEGIEHGNRFFTSHKAGDDPTKSAKGETWYRVLGYADTIEEAQKIIYPNPGDAEWALRLYVIKTAIKMGLIPVGA